jgi:Na+/proline symporter/signal transduction histidine kinase/CheY-like chemotaxis protein
MNFDIDIVIVGIYLIATLVIGIWKGRGVRSMKEYAVGNKDYATFVLVATILATLIGGSSTIGTIEKIHSVGIIFGVLHLGYVIQKIIIAYIVAPRIENFKGAISCGDIVEKLYGNCGRFITGIASFVYCSAGIAMQIAAIGYLFYYYLDVSYMIGILLGAGAIVFYSTFGGIRAVVTTDVFQFAILIVAFPVLCNLGLNKVGGYDGLFNAVPADRMVFLDKDAILRYVLPLFLLISIPFNPATAQRVLMAKDKKQLKSSMLISAIIEIPFFYLIAILGLIALALYPELESKQAVPHMINDLLPIGFKGVVLAGILAVMMSSADSFLNTGAVTLVNDVLKFFVEIKSEKKRLLYTRLASLMLGAFGVTIAIEFQSILDISASLMGLWMSTILLPMFFGIIGIRIPLKGFVATIICGLVSYFIWDFIYEDVTGINSILVGLFVNATAFFIFYVSSNLTKSPTKTEGNSGSSLKEQILPKLKAISLYTPKFILKRCVELSSRQVNRYGAQYTAFGVLLLMTYFLPIFSDTNPDMEQYLLTTSIKIISACLSFGLIMHFHWPEKLRPYLPIYWYVTLMFTLPFANLTLLFTQGPSTSWLISTTVSLFILVLVVDWASFTVILLLGIISAYSFCVLSGCKLAAMELPIGTVFEFSYIYIFTILIGAIFSRNKEFIHRQVVGLLESKVSERTSELTRALAIRKEVMNNVSHEIRIPIHGVINMSQEVVDQWDRIDSEKKKMYIQKVADSGNRLMSMVSNLLDLSQAEAGKMQLSLKKHDLGNLIYKVVKEFDQFKESGIKIKIPAKLRAMAEFDKERMVQVIQNLISNAIRYGKKNIEISLSNTENSQLQFAISDHGVGVPEDQLHTIFQPFEQSTATKTGAGGTGLGLAICRDMIEAHKGKIWVENNEGEGAVFKFTIPYSQDEDLIDKPALKKKTLNIMIIDDEETVRMSGSLIIESMGHKVVTMDGGTSALEYLNSGGSEKIDLILLDLMMPDMYGLNVLERLKGNNKLRDIRVVLQTGSEDRKEIDKAYQLGIIAHLHKPYGKKAFKQMLYSL